jgi:hypothetical protein
MLAQAVMFLTFIQEVPGWNFGQDTDCPDQGLLWFSSVLPGKFQGITLNYAMITSSHILSNSSFTIINHLMLYRLSY